MPQNRLKFLREALGWNRERLASYLGVSERTVYRYERGDFQIPDVTKAQLCDLFGVSLDHLLGRDRREDNGGNGASRVSA